MIIDRSPTIDAPTLDPCAYMDPVLRVLDSVLDDDALFCRVKADFSRRRPHSPCRGRPSTPVEVILRMLVLRRLYDWSYEQTEHLVGDSLSLRHFCRIRTATVPDDTTLLRWANCLRPETLTAVCARVVALAVERGVTHGRKLRVDGTVVATTIHPPSDSRLLADGARMMGRLLHQARDLVGDRHAPCLFRSFARSAKRLARVITRAAQRGVSGREDREMVYRRLLQITTLVCHHAHQVRACLPDAGDAGRRLADRIDRLLPRLEQVVTQTQRRVIEGTPVPATEKIVSLTEPHSAILVRDAGHQTEFGHRVILGESEGGIITSYAVLPGTESEAEQLPAILAQHAVQTGCRPYLLTADRGFYAPGQREWLSRTGIQRVVIPVQGGRRPAHEHTRWFRRGQRFRVGIEGRISVSKRNGWLGRCRDHGKDGFDRWISWGILSNNLVALTRHDLHPTA